MRRDDDLMRQLMLDLEQANSLVTDKHPVDGHTRDAVAYHLALIVKAGLAEGPSPMYSSTGVDDPTVPNNVIVKRLTPAGHDFISNLRDETVWRKVKQRAGVVGGAVSLELLSDLARAVVREKLGL